MGIQVSRGQGQGDPTRHGAWGVARGRTGSHVAGRGYQARDRVPWSPPRGLPLHGHQTYGPRQGGIAVWDPQRTFLPPGDGVCRRRSLGHHPRDAWRAGSEPAHSKIVPLGTFPGASSAAWRPGPRAGSEGIWRGEQTASLFPWGQRDRLAAMPSGPTAVAVGRSRGGPARPRRGAPAGGLHGLTCRRARRWRALAESGRR